MRILGLPRNKLLLLVGWTSSPPERAGETPTPQEKLNIFLFGNPLSEDKTELRIILISLCVVFDRSWC